MRLLRAFLVLSLLLLPQMANAETLMMATTTSTQKGKDEESSEQTH